MVTVFSKRGLSLNKSRGFLYLGRGLPIVGVFNPLLLRSLGLGDNDKPPRSIPREVLTRPDIEGFASTADDDGIDRGHVDDLPEGE